MSHKPIIDADFEVVSGPYRVGDEHRKRRGWYWTGRYDKNGVPLWYRPPARYWRWLRPALLALLYLGIPFLALGVPAIFAR